MYPFLNRQAI